MIKIRDIEISKDNIQGVKKFVFPLSVSRNVWLSDNKLVIEYPMRFDELQNVGDAVVFSLLPIAYNESSNIELPKNLPIRNTTQQRVDNICELWNKWFSCNRRVKIFSNVTDTPSNPNQDRHPAQLFSGGVDSLTTFKRHRNEIKYLVLYRGADIPISRPERFREIKNYMEGFAKEQNKELITISTNVHYLGQVSWEHIAHSCAMAGPILAISNYINKLYIGATFAGEFAKNISWGSHPDIDPLVGTQRFETIHDGVEMEKPEKIKFLSEEPALLKKLRVCSGNINNSFNCGKCEKCYRTTTVLSLLGFSEKDAPFPRESFNFDNISNFLLNHTFRKDTKLSWSYNLDFLESSPIDVKGKEKIMLTSRTILGDFYTDFKNGSIDYLFFEYISRWRKIEKLFGLKPDSLEWLKKIIRSFRGSLYKAFVKKYEHLQKIY